MIPKKFKLGSRTWTVHRGVRMSDLGDCDGQRCVIRLSRKNKDAEEELHTFCHELVHAFEFALGWELKHNKLDALANMLAQYLTTAE